MTSPQSSVDIQRSSSDRPHPSTHAPLKLDLRATVDGCIHTFTDIPWSNYHRVADGLELAVAKGETLDISIHRTDGLEMDVANLSIDFTLPLLNYHRVIVPDCGRNYALSPYPLLLWGTSHFVTAPNAGHPFVCFTDQSGGAVASIGIVGEPREIGIECTEPGRSNRFTLVAYSGRLCLRFTIPGGDFRYGKVDQIRESLYFCKSAATWFHALRGYTDLCKSRLSVQYTIEDDAYSPAWCSWTAWYSGDMDQDLVLQNAHMVSKLGIRNMVIDDGWFGPGLDVDDQTLTIGDYYPDPARFPDLQGLVKSIQDLGLKVLLWVAPLACAPSSKLMPKAESMLIRHNGELQMTSNGFYNLCPCHAPARKYILSELARMVREYGVDGFKHDLYNCLPTKPCNAEHHHDTDSMLKGMHLLMKEAWENLREIRPGGILELKQNYGNVYGAQFGSCVRAGDTPYDIDLNLLRCFYAQAYAGVVWNDYLAWSQYEADEDVGRMLIKMIAAGVPTFSIDFSGIPESHCRVVSTWLQYYNSRLNLWKQPRSPQDADLQVWQIDSNDEVWIALVGTSNVCRLRSAKRMTICNASPADEILVMTKEEIAGIGTAYDSAGVLSEEAPVILDGLARITVPIGGRLEIALYERD